VVEGDDYVLSLAQDLSLLGCNPVFEQAIAAGFQGGFDFLASLTDASRTVFGDAVASGKLDGARLELRHVLIGGTRTVEYTFWRHESGWVGVGRDRSDQLEIVKQMAVLVEELETRVHRERAVSADLRTLAEKDALTGLSNRRHFQRVLSSARESCETGHGMFSILCIDVDNYKQVNDRYGHAVGDRVLKTVARVLEESLRDCDCVARTGGDEFLVLVTNLDGAKCGELAERLRQNVAEADMPAPAGRVTVSVGVASADPGSPDWVERLVDKADKALYTAKESGRNQVSTARADAESCG
jgi:diguanylate cyclase (GGDEF)-like protein